MKTIKILLTSAGRRGQLVKCFRRSAKTLESNLVVFAADLSPELSAACHLADQAFRVPRCTTGEYIPALLKLCRENEVDILVPTIDTELLVLSQNSGLFAAQGTRVVVSGPHVVAIARDKMETSKRLSAAGIHVPQTLMLAEYLADPSAIDFPVIAKPLGGSSSVGLLRPKHVDELAGLNPEDYLVQELWKGAEYTVNVFFDDEGRLRSVVPHRRIEVRGGEVSKGRTERVPILMDYAEKLGGALDGAVGPLCFQAIVKESGEAAVFEINARFGGGYPLAHQAGAEFSKWLLEETAGLPSSSHSDWKEGLTMLRYDTAVFCND